MRQYVMFKYCPVCASEKIEFRKNVFRCPDCNLVYYHNTACASGCLITDGEKLLFTVRGKDPGKGLLDLPGGFVDPGEGILESLARELKEEIGWVPSVSQGKSITGIYKFFASFPNIYPYKGFLYNTCDFYFLVNVPELNMQEFIIDKKEITEIRLLKPNEINLNDIAFKSVESAVKLYLNHVLD